MYRVIQPKNRDVWDDVSIRVNGEAVKAERCRVSKYPLNVVWPGHQRPLSQTEFSGYLRIVADEPVEIEAEYARAFSRALVRPLGREIEVRSDGKRASFTLSRPGQYVLEFDNIHASLCLFVDAPRDFSEYGEPTIRYGAGTHEAGRVILKSGDRVFLEEGAVVRGGFFAEDAEDVAIYGYGVIDDGWEDREALMRSVDPKKLDECYYDWSIRVNSNARFIRCKNLRLDGVTMVDAQEWTVQLYKCDDILIRDVKIVGNWTYNCDGIDVCNSSHATISDSFVRVFDDVITLKGLGEFADHPLEDITVERCVLWCDWNNNCEIGMETAADYYRNIRFRDCDLIHNSVNALDIFSGDYAEIYDILYEDIRIEYQKGQHAEVYEAPLGRAYDFDVPYVPRPIRARAYTYNPSPALAKAREGKSEKSYIHDVTYRNITIYLEEGCPMPEIEFDEGDHAVYGTMRVEKIRLVTVK